MTRIYCLIAFLAAGLVLGNACVADVIHDESINGDLSDDNLAPTSLVFGLGSNEILGATTFSPVDRDFWTFSIAAGQQLDSVILQSYVTTEDQSWFAVGSGNSISAINDPGVLLGGQLVGAAAGRQQGDDVLDDLGASGNGTGFIGPLGAGDYTFWFQEVSADTSYAFNFNVSAVPEPSAIIILAGLSAVGAIRRRRSK